MSQLPVRRNKRLTEEDVVRILEDIPLDNSENTDIEDDEDESEVQSSCLGTFDDIFERELSRIHGEIVNAEPEQLRNSSDSEDEPESSNNSDEVAPSQHCGHPNGQEKQGIQNDNRKWRKRDFCTTVPEYKLLFDISESKFGHCTSATDIFCEMLSPAVENIVFQSNLYATQRNKTLNLKAHEFFAFVGINFFMGYHKLPSWRHYWSTSEDLGISVVRQTMSRDRFDFILSSLHVNDNAQIPHNNTDKLFKLRPLISTLNGTFPEVYSGTREISVDESMILFKGRSCLKQYNPMKPVKRGYKLWCVADMKGYILGFDVYQGRNEVLEEEFSGYGLGERVVLQLTKSFWNTHRKVYFDNFFTSLPLLEKLKKEGTLACGTIRANRKGLPQNFGNGKSMERGEYDHRVSSTDTTVFQWKDNKVVLFASNFHGNEGTTVSRKLKDGSSVLVPCPIVVDDYNKHMGGVDHADRLRSVYGLGRRSKKWWHRLFWGMMEITFVNSYVVYCELFEKIPLLEFRRNVSLGLMNKIGIQATGRSPRARSSVDKNICAKRRKSEYSVCKDVRLGNCGSHFVKFVENRGRCEVCSRNKVQSRPYSKCTACGVFLCCNDKKNCFSVYHGVTLD